MEIWENLDQQEEMALMVFLATMEARVTMEIKAYKELTAKMERKERKENRASKVSQYSVCYWYYCDTADPLAPLSTGSQGNSGPQGTNGHAGQKGEQGFLGNVGLPGSRGPQGSQGTPGAGSSHVIAVHSRSSRVPECPGNSVLLWEGYSLSNDVSFPDMPIGSGSCMQLYSSRFGPLPWLGIQNVVKDKAEYGAEDVSRCSVCEVSSSLLTVHSLTTSLPACPETWSSLWEGYSFIYQVGVSMLPTAVLFVVRDGLSMLAPVLLSVL